MDPKGSYSTSNLARLIKAPLVLIVDCTKTTRTTAAVLYGVKSFERGLRIGGVVLNQVSGSRHERVTREAVEHYTGLHVLGAIPRLSEAELPERHMGLTPWQEHPDVQAAVGRAADIIEAHVNVERVLEITRELPSLTVPRRKAVRKTSADVRIGVIRDSAFQFYYPENIEALRELGAEVVEFSALTEKSLPAVDALYIGGGFPETHAIALSRNRPFRKSLLKAIEEGLPVYAECGGLMFLGEAITLGKKSYPMAGVFPVNFELYEKPSAHGYTRVKVTKKNPFYPKGTELRGHEFHYSEAVGKVPARALAFEMTRGTGIAKGRDAFTYKNVLATYTHIHALGVPAWAEGMVRAARQHRKSLNT
jgi:cobyrinic acid a,c-diamide synthase